MKLKRPLTLLLPLFLLVALLISACQEEESAEPAAPPQADGQPSLRDEPPPDQPRTVAVHLFEWRWNDIALECEGFLGPAGYAAVQVSPPQEHVVAPGFPWWQRYQPVSYKLESRSGTRQEFAEMVTRCEAAGVDIYVDAVINHMAGMESGVGIAGTPFSHYDYPGLYSANDFHYCGTPNDDITNYGNTAEVQSCELVNLADLNTGSEYVRDRLAAYLNDLLSLGVAGFRLDAAKHMNPADIRAILDRLERDPYIYQEVIDQGGEPIQANQYFLNGDVTEFRYSVSLGRVFHSGRLAELEHFGEGWGFMPSDRAIVFVNNHDNQRGHGGAGGVVTYKDGRLYDLANIFMLAWPYGYPKVMSTFAFDNGDQGPPSDGEGHTRPIYQDGQPDCFEEWICEHRWRPVANMVAFRNQTAGHFFVSDWWSNGNDQIAFGRGEAGFVILNREEGQLSHTFQTSLAPGLYCDVISGDLAAGGQSCTGMTLTVDGSGRLAAVVPAMSAIAIHGGARPQAEPAGPLAPVAFRVQAEAVPGENIFVAGNVAALGGWDPDAAVPLSPDDYPLWQATVELPTGAAVEYKYIRKDEAGSVVWESDPNRQLTVPPAGLTLDERWR
jgi:alpha-amylase